MKKLLLALLLIACPAWAQTKLTPKNTAVSGTGGATEAGSSAGPMNESGRTNKQFGP
jgi:hypothetical protein